MKSRLLLHLIPSLLMSGCGTRPMEQEMPAAFSPPGVASLAEIDEADETYGSAPVVIQGVVSPSGQGGWDGSNEGYEVHCFSFAAWRRPGEAVVQRELTILRPVPPDADYFEDFPAYSVHRISVLLSDDGLRAVFEKALQMDSPDAELLAIADELKRPVIVATDRFGELTLDRNIGRFEGEAEWNGTAVRISVPVDGDLPEGDALRTGESLWSDQATWNKRIEQCAVKHLLELKNDAWLDDDESEITAEQFLARMTLMSISLSSDGAFSFWYDDGDLFFGHSIMVSGNLRDGPLDAGIHG